MCPRAIDHISRPEDRFLPAAELSGLRELFYISVRVFSHLSHLQSLFSVTTSGKSDFPVKITSREIPGKLTSRESLLSRESRLLGNVDLYGKFTSRES